MPSPRTLSAWLAALTASCASLVTNDRADRDAAADVDVAADAPMLGRRERCNGLDDDLDGRVDEGCPVRLTDDPLDDTDPTLSGGRVAWLRNDPREQTQRGALMTLRLGAAGERRLTDRASYPSLAGERVVFYRDDGCVLYDLAAGTSAPVAHGDPGPLTFRQRCVIGGDVVAWSEARDTSNDDYDVWLVDARTGAPRRLTAERAQQWRPQTDGRFVAWIDSRRQAPPVWPDSPTRFDVFAAEVSGGAAVNVTGFERDGDNALAVAAVDAGRALVLERHDGDGGATCAVAVYDLRTRARTELWRDASACVATAWALSGDLAVIERDTRGASDLWLHDLRGGAPRQLTRHSRHSTTARLSGPWLVWADDRNDTWDLYAMDLTDLDRGDLSPEGVTP